MLIQKLRQLDNCVTSQTARQHLSTDTEQISKTWLTAVATYITNFDLYCIVVHGQMTFLKYTWIGSGMYIEKS